MPLAMERFNSSATGYSSGLTGGSRGIMDVWDLNAKPSAEDDFYGNNHNSNGSLQAAFSAADPIYGDNQQTTTQSLVQGDTIEETLMEKMHPDKEYTKISGNTSAENINTQKLYRDASKTVTDGAAVKKEAGKLEIDTDKAINDFKSDFKQARMEAMDQLKESAENMDIPVDQALDSLIPDGSAGKAQAAMYLGVELAASGMGSLATAPGKAAYVSQELSKQDKKLSPDQQKALLEDMTKNLQASRSAPSDTRAAGGGGPSVPVDVPHERVAWENMESEDIKNLLAADPEGEDQPEMEILRDLEHAIEDVQDNHEFVANNYHALGDIFEKTEALVETGQSNVAKDQVDNAQVVADAADVDLASQSLNGIVRLDTSAVTQSEVIMASVSEVATKTDVEKLDTAVLQNELSQYMSAEIRPGAM